MAVKANLIRVPYAKSHAPSNQCGVFPSYTVDDNGKCSRYISCNISDHTKNPKCPAKGGK